jgi:CDP-paratose 2-epimerase
MTPVAIITGCNGLVGSEAVRHFVEQGFDVVGLDNDMRAFFFGPDASTRGVGDTLLEEYSLTELITISIDIRDREAVESVFALYGPKVELVVHAAAQPAHDWAAKDPHTDFEVNAVGTLNLLDATRKHCIDAPFVHCSTSKVYGANPNDLPLEELPTRLDLPEDHRYHRGIDTTMSIDQTTHSLFGASKAAGDLLVQEYGNYFGMPTVCFRPGCLTGPKHAGAQLHGFLSYLMKCAMTGQKYTVFGYGGKQVRCNLHAADLVRAFDEFRRAPSAGAVYNIGGGRDSNCSMIEAIAICEELTGRELDRTYEEENRIGDHRWWISSNAAFQADYPGWKVEHNTKTILQEIFEVNRDRWS